MLAVFPVLGTSRGRDINTIPDKKERAPELAAKTLSGTKEKSRARC